jgi:hypothetical protein
VLQLPDRQHLLLDTGMRIKPGDEDGGGPLTRFIAGLEKLTVEEREFLQWPLPLDEKLGGSAKLVACGRIAACT